MKNSFFPIFFAFLIGALPTYWYYVVYKKSECKICITEAQIAEVYPEANLVEKKFDANQMLKDNKFITEINQQLSNIQTVRISTKFSEEISKECGGTKGVSFQFLEILKGLMESQGVSTLGSLNVNSLSSIGFTSVFAQYPQNPPADWPTAFNYNEYKGKTSAFIHLIEKNGNNLKDIKDVRGEFYRYNIGTICPHQCPEFLQQPSLPTPSVE